MKRIFNQHRAILKHCAGSMFIIFVAFFLCAPAFGQDEEKKESDGKKPARPAFESAQLMDEQSVVVQSPKTLEFNLQHRFGTVNNGISDLYGIYAPANIRMGFSYTPIKNLALGFGTTKLNMYVDVNAKYAILKQTRDWSMPVSVTFFTNVVMDPRGTESYPKSVYRLSFFDELIVACRLSPKISLQFSPSYSHYNAMDSGYLHTMWAVGFSGRYKFSPQSSFMFNYTQQLNSHPDPAFKVRPGLTFGFEVATSAHAFQIFAGTFQGILPQRNMMYNQNNYSKGQFVIGFNITRLWGF